MKILSLTEIVKMDSPAQTSVLEYWNDYSQMSVLLAYGELKRKNYPLPHRAEKGKIDFCKKNEVADMDSFLEVKMKEAGFNSYPEYYQKIYVDKTEKEKLTKNLSQVNPLYIRAAGKCLKDVVWIIIVGMILCMLTVIFIVTAREVELSINAYIMMLLVSLVVNILVLLRIYSAGNNLERSVS